MKYLLNYVFDSLSDESFEKMFEFENGVLQTSKLCDFLVSMVGVSLAVTTININKKINRLRIGWNVRPS